MRFGEMVHIQPVFLKSQNYDQPKAGATVTDGNKVAYLSLINPNKHCIISRGICAECCLDLTCGWETSPFFLSLFSPLSRQNISTNSSHSTASSRQVETDGIMLAAIQKKFPKPWTLMNSN